MKRVAKNVVNFLLGMLTVTFVVILVGNLWMMYQSTVQHSKSPSILGYSPLIVNTGSMEGNKADDFNVGDLVVIHKTENTLNLKKGTIITFVDPHSESKALVTHRINRVVTHDKDHVYETKGDANNTIDKGAVRCELDERVLVTTLTKRMAEELAKYLTKVNIRCRYIHSDIDTLERIEIMQDLRKGLFD